MKTKSKLVLGLSILSAATLAAGATSTFAWYVASNGGALGTKTSMALSQAAIQADASTVDVALTATDAAKLMLTEATNGKSYYYTDANHLDAQHRVEKQADENHLKSIVVTATFTPDADFNVADGTYYITIAVASQTPLRITNAAGLNGSSYGAYVGETKTVYTSVSVANGKFTAFSKTFVLSMTGQDGENETSLGIAANSGFAYTWGTSTPGGSDVAMDSAE